MQNRLPFIRSFFRKNPALSIALSAAVIIASIFILSKARFDSDVTRLIPTHAEKTSLYFDIMQRFGGMEKAYIFFSADRIIEHAPAIDRIGQELLESGLVRKAAWKISDSTRAFLRDVYAKKAVLMISEEEMSEFINRLSPEGMSHELKKTRQRLALPGGQEMLARIDPLNLFELFSYHMNISDVSFDFRSGYFMTPDGKSIIMIVDPEKSPRDIAFSRKFIDETEKILAKYRGNNFSAELTGSHAITLHEASVMKSEIIKNILMSVAAVVLIFLLFFRSLKGLLYVLMPVLAAITTAMGGMLAVTGTLSEVTGAFAGLIVGLGIDLGIVLYVRYLINAETSADRTDCMDRSISQVYRGITTGVITTALTFLPMLFSSFKGIRELGLLTGAGILLCWIFLFGLVSLLIRPSTGRFAEITLIRRFSLYAYHHPAAVLSLGGAMTLLFIFFIPRIEVTGDITKLGTKDNPARRTLEKMEAGYIKEYGIFITDTLPDFESALHKSLELKERLKSSLSDIKAAGDILPPVERQQTNILALSSLNADKILNDFDRNAKSEGFDISLFSEFKTGLRSMLLNREMITPEDLQPIREVLDRLIIQDGNSWSIIVAGNLRENAPLNVLDDLSFTGRSLIKKELLSILRDDAVVISIVGLVLVNIVLFLDFRNIYYVFLCQLPVFISILWVLGIMGLSGISLNFMNTIVFVMLIGIGTDYTVHLLHRYLADRDIGSTFLQTGKSVLVAGLTTIAGFGSIGFSSYRGLATMGQVAAIGAALCVILSLSLIPALLRLHEDRSKDN